MKATVNEFVESEEVFAAARVLAWPSTRTARAEMLCR